MSGEETIASRFIKLNHIILGKSNYDFPNRYLAHRDGLLDVLFALYEECNVDYMRRDKHIAAFVDKFKGVIVELKSLRVNVRDFEVKKIIGRGHFGEVQVVREKSTGDVYAMKILSKEKTLSQQNMAFYKEERDIMSKTTSPWLTKVQYAFQDSQNLYLIMEFHPGGDMLSLLEKYDNVLSDDMCQFYLAELVLAIHSLHLMGYVHRDIKPDNILIDRTGHIKLADFGSASKLNSHKQVTSSMPVGTPDYVAPEVLAAMNLGPFSSRSYGIECDWWSLGIVAYEMVFGSTPFADDKVLNTYNNIMNFKNSLKFPAEAAEVSKALIGLIKDLLNDASNRLGYDQLIDHQFFTDIDWNNIRHIAPPYVPTVTSVDDTSNFDDFEPENRLYIGDLKGKKEFTGKNLPFVGFTYTTPIDVKFERISSIDETGIMSPSSSFCETGTSSRRREIAVLQGKISDLSSSNESLTTEMNKLKANSEAKEEELHKVRNEKTLLEGIVEELTTEVQQVRQLLSYEREHRVITEKKAAQITRCMKTKQRQDAIRLKAKSIEFSGSEKEHCTLEEQLEEALAKIDEFVLERAELLEDLEATKHTLLECQKKYNENDTNLSMLPSDGEKNKSGIMNNSQISMEKHSGNTDFRRLVFKLEKKNVELEKDLEKAASEKRKLEASNSQLQSTTAALKIKISELQKEINNMAKIKANEEVQNTINLSSSTADSKEDTLTEGTSGFSEELAVENPEEKNLQNANENGELFCEGSETKGKKKSVSLSVVPQMSIDLPCGTESSETDCIPARARVLQDLANNQESMISLSSASLTDESNFKEENEYLKSRIELLNQEIRKLENNLREKENLYSSFEDQLKEKESAISEAKIDLRISVRKQKEADDLVSCLRERNKELRDRIKSLEESVDEKIKIENDLKEKLNNLESEVCEKKQELAEKEKLFEIEKAKLQYTCEVSKDVTQKFVKSQDHYETVVKQNMDLLKENEGKSQANSHLLQEVQHLKIELKQKKNECAKFEKLTSVLKTTCKDLNEQLDDLRLIVESKEKTVEDLLEHQRKLKSEMKSVEEDLKLSRSDLKKLESESRELVAHIEQLTSEMDSSSVFHETEMQNLLEQLDYYKKIAIEMKEQNSILQKDVSSQNSDCKGYSEKIMYLESYLQEIKEEASRHITQVSSLKSSNLKLTQDLEDACEDLKEAQRYTNELLNELESVRASHIHDKVKLQETLAQQTKLIDFLQAKTENMEKRKKPHLSRLFGKKENCNTMPLQYKDVEKLLETEKSRCRRLQDQLSQARAEIVALQREVNNLKSSTINVEVPQSPLSRAMHCVITQSPSADHDKSPALASRELVNKFSKPPGMKHKIPHRFVNILCMRSSKCCACLDSLHFGRTIAKCQECALICHPTCATSLPSTCGLPPAFMQHFKTAINNCTSSNAVENSESKLSEGWIKIPKNNKLGWDRRYLRVVDQMLCLFENAEEIDPSKALMKLDIRPEVAKIVVTSAVSAAELSYAASSDLPYVLKLEYVPHTTCWPKRSLYVMTQSFSDKQMWVSTLEDLAEENETEVDSCKKNKLVGKAVWTMKGDRLMDPLCTYILDGAIILLGADDGLYVLKIVNKFTCALKCKIDGLQYIYQIAALESIGLMIFIQGEEKRLTMTHLSSVQSAVQKIGNSSLNSTPFSDISDCHLFAVEDTDDESPYLCVATSKLIKLYQWDSVLKTFGSKKVIETKEPCSCIHFTLNSILFGTDSFYCLDLNAFTLKNFLDDRDASLAGLIYGASQYRSYPIAIFEVSYSHKVTEYLLCFHEMGVFVNGNGQRTRTEDMKWSRLPLSFAYQFPYLFVTHFNSVEVIEILPAHVTEAGLQAVTHIKNPQYIGPAHASQSIYLSSCHDQIVELILVDGASIGKSEIQLHESENGSLGSCSPSSSEKGSLVESDGLDFSFSTSIDQSLAEYSVDQESLSSKTSSETASSQS